MKTVEEFKSSVEQKRRVLLARIEKDKSILNRYDLYLTDPEKFFKKVVKSKVDYEKKKTKSTPTQTTTETPPKKPSVLDTIF